MNKTNILLSISVLSLLMVGCSDKKVDDKKLQAISDVKTVKQVKAMPDDKISILNNTKDIKVLKNDDIKLKSINDVKKYSSIKSVDDKSKTSIDNRSIAEKLKHIDDKSSMDSKSNILKVFSGSDNIIKRKDDFRVSTVNDDFSPEYNIVSNQIMENKMTDKEKESRHTDSVTYDNTYKKMHPGVDTDFNNNFVIMKKLFNDADEKKQRGSDLFTVYNPTTWDKIGSFIIPDKVFNIKVNSVNLTNGKLLVNYSVSNNTSSYQKLNFKFQGYVAGDISKTAGFQKLFEYFKNQPNGLESGETFNNTAYMDVSDFILKNGLFLTFYDLSENLPTARIGVK